MTSSADTRASEEPAPPGGGGQGARQSADSTTTLGERSAGARVPEFFIVGHQKCGTTALYTMLRQHPQIFMPSVKEPRFFASDQRSRFATPAPSTVRPRTLEDYLALFADARPDQLAGEASPQYLRSAVAAGGIASLQPDARIVAILREPASYLRSFHLQMVSSAVETQQDFKKAMALEDERRRGKRIPQRCQHPEALLYSDHVRYVQQLRRYHELFPRERVLVLVYEDFLRDNQATVRQVLQFLELDDMHPVDPTRTYPVRSIRHLSLHYLANAGRRARRNPPAAGLLGHTINALTPAFARSTRFQKRWRRIVYEPAPPPDEQFMLELRRRFKGEVEAIGDYLGRDLVSTWGYDRLS